MIETERLLLRPPEPGDADVIFRIVSDPEVMSYLGGEVGTQADAAEHLARLQRSWEADGFGHFIVVPREPGEAVGRVGLLVWKPDFSEYGTRQDIGDDAEIELGWTLERAAWGKGYASEAATAIRDWTLEHVRPRRLISLINEANVRSQRVAEKIGEEYREDVLLYGSIPVGLWQLRSPA